MTIELTFEKFSQFVGSPSILTRIIRHTHTHAHIH